MTVSADRKEKEKVQSQKEGELGWTDERMEDRKETGGHVNREERKVTYWAKLLGFPQICFHEICFL